MKEDIEKIEVVLKKDTDASKIFAKLKKILINIEDEKLRLKNVEKRLKGSNYEKIFETEVNNIKLRASEEFKIKEKFWLSKNASLIINGIKWIIITIIAILFLNYVLNKNIEHNTMSSISKTTQKILEIIQKNDINSSI